MDHHLSFQFILHIHDNDNCQGVKKKLQAGEDPALVNDWYNAHPTSGMIQYLTHGSKLWSRKEVMAVFQEKLRIYTECV